MTHILGLGRNNRIEINEHRLNQDNTNQDKNIRGTQSTKKLCSNIIIFNKSTLTFKHILSLASKLNN